MFGWHVLAGQERTGTADPARGSAFRAAAGRAARIRGPPGRPHRPVAQCLHLGVASCHIFVISHAGTELLRQPASGLNIPYREEDT